MPSHASRLRRILVALAKIALACALLAYLLNQARQHDTFAQLAEQPKQWSRLVLGLCATFACIAMCFVRWHLLVRAVGISTRLLDTMRLGALGYALNFVSLGSIGGDLFKAVFLAHEQPGRRTEAVVSVVADRVLGLLTFLILASGGILASDLKNDSPPPLAALCNAVLTATTVTIAGAAVVLLVPQLSGPGVMGRVARLPLVGATAARLLGTIQAYRNQKHVLVAAAAISFVANIANITAFYLVASGLPIESPTYGEHYVIVPVANMVGAIPATPNGLGTREAAVDVLYRTVSSNERIAKGVGTMVTLAFRVTEMAVAVLGLAYYLCHRSEVREVYQEAEEVAEAV
jgi:uncharacterized membrane protein YbhN (UPF0104 family)